jgi:hypothetical protein
LLRAARHAARWASSDAEVKTSKLAKLSSSRTNDPTLK